MPPAPTIGDHTPGYRNTLGLVWPGVIPGVILPGVAPPAPPPGWPPSPADGLKKGSKGRERRKDEEDEENVAAVQRLFNLLFRNSLHPSLFLRLSLPSSSFLCQPRRLPSVHLLFYVRDGGRDKENEERVAAVQRTVLSSLSKQCSCFSFSASFFSLVLFPRRPSERAFVAQRAGLAALRFLSPSSPLFPLL